MCVALEHGKLQSLNVEGFQKSRPLIGYLKLANCRHASESRVEAHVAWILLFLLFSEMRWSRVFVKWATHYACKVSNNQIL